MNLFFGLKTEEFSSQLIVPRFTNQGRKRPELVLFESFIEDGKWRINRIKNIEINDEFIRLNAEAINNDNIFFLASPDMVEKNYNKISRKLISIDSFTDGGTSEYRANLQVSAKNGGFSSYQSDYPFHMATKKGNVLAPVAALCNKNSEKNILFFKNIYECPVKVPFKLNFINIETKEIVHQATAYTNYTNEVSIGKELIEPNIFIFSDNYIGIPIFLSMKNGHLSLEHTHPAHESILGKYRYTAISKLKREILGFIN
jgi:hypothetical protein